MSGRLKEYVERVQWQKCILIWIKYQKKSRKHQRSVPTDTSAGEVELPKTKRAGPGYTVHTKNMIEILEKLTQKHEDNYIPDQSCAWAHMIQMKKHASYDVAPTKPFFGSKSKKRSGCRWNSLTP